MQYPLLERNEDRRYKLTSQEVEEVKIKLSSTSHKALAREYGVSPSVIGRIADPERFKKYDRKGDKRRPLLRNYTKESERSIKTRAYRLSLHEDKQRVWERHQSLKKYYRKKELRKALQTGD